MSVVNLPPSAHLGDAVPSLATRRDAAPSREAFHALYRAHVGYVWHSVRRLGVPERDVEDVTHDTMLAVYRKLADFDPTRPLRPWLFGYAYRVAADYRKRVRRRPEIANEHALEREDSAPNAEQAALKREQQELVMRALAQLPLERAAVLVLIDIDGFSAPEAAASLAIPVNTVYSRLRVAREEFATAVRRERDHNGGAT